ncbi:MAG: metalloregulator ArsR/SmtB family transcription factor [Bryobacteraceae bacterium]
MKEERFLEIARAVSDPTRFAILSRIAQAGPEFACANLTQCMEITPATISHHVKELSAAGLIEGRKEGKFTFYKVNQASWSEYLKELSRRVPTA